MTREEKLRKVLDKVLWTRNASDENKDVLVEAIVEALEQEPTTKNDLGVDLISRADLYNRIKTIDHDEDYECDEYGGNRITYHTCDWDEVLREIEDAPSVTPQEPFINKPCVSSGVCEHDKQEVLDKISAEIEELPTDYPTFAENYTAYGMKNAVLKIIAKYKVESEEKT